ncbi:uncharacterized protein [Watersipora subatra]|uniref:uncharacterized protein n=1 Tax=Watersipora subatra TaxID=2589382 RepID=UPI00355AEA10
MAMRKVWIKNTAVILAVFLFIFVIAQLCLTALVNVWMGIYVQLNSSIELVCIALFITPAIWVTFAAAMSRHRGVYVAMTALVSLSFLSSMAFIVYEGYVFGRTGYYTNRYEWLSGLMIGKLVCWAISLIIIIVLLGVAIAATCSMDGKGPKKEFEYYQNQGFARPAYTLPPEYAPTSYQTRDYPRIASSRYFGNRSSPRSHYPKYY